MALDIYLSGDAGPRGCFTVMTAASEAVSDPEIRAMVLEGFIELDKAFAACFRLAKEKGELPETADPVVLAQLASATIHTIAIRARAQRAAQGTGSDRQGCDRCDGARLNHIVVPGESPQIPNKNPPRRVGCGLASFVMVGWKQYSGV